MNSNFQGFLHSRPAVGAQLRSPSGVNFLVPASSAFSLDPEYIQEHSPSRIRNRFSKISILNHPLYIKIFNSKTIIRLYKAICRLVAEIKSLIRNSFISSCNKPACFFSALRSSFPAAKPSISFCKSLFGFSKKFRSFYFLSVICSNKRIKTHINPNFFTCFWKEFRFIFNYERDIPFVIPSSNRKRFYFSNNRPMPFNLNIPHVLKVETLFFYLTTIAKSQIIYCIKSIRSFKSWISWFFSYLDSVEKRFKSFVQSPERLLERTTITKRNAFIYISQLRQQIHRLRKITDPFASRFINFFSFLKRLIIEKSMTVKLFSQCFNLLAIWVKSIFIGFNHLFETFFPVPVRRFAFRTDTNFLFSGIPLMPASFAFKLFNNFNLHYNKYNLLSKFCQVKC